MVFDVRVTSKGTTAQSVEGAAMVSQILFDEAIKEVEEGNVDFLIVPGGVGGGFDAVLKTTDDPHDIFGVIRAFLKYSNKNGPSQVSPWLISMCTGALIVAEAGSFVGLPATTHCGGIFHLQKICKAQGGPSSTVVRKRWVDAGVNENGIHILNSGSISCGLDAMLYFVKMVLGVQAAVDISAMMEYVWNGGGFAGLQPSSAPGQPMKEALGVGWTTRQW